MKQLQTSRPRNTCPNCGSLSLRKKVMIGSYVCERCDWHGRMPVKKMVSTRHLIPTEDRVKHLAKVHAAHPDWKKTDLRRIETEQIVDLYLKGAVC